MVTILPSNEQGTGSIPGQESKILTCHKVQPNYFLIKKIYFFIKKNFF